MIAALDAIRAEDPRADRAALLAELSGVTGLAPAQVGVALRYYAAYPDEVDERIALNQEVADREEQLWEAQQELLRRRKH
ncbi:hypothetical protein [Krasilnikovia sp. M28-CT-15]|uniref:hypothetical protein n=1 Tax=Krasilnikovia sp. M28-CT-15 TaxID=3373540 RepID=UPI003876A48E